MATLLLKRSSDSKLQRVFFEGDAPSAGGTSVFYKPFYPYYAAVYVYYLPGTSGWTNSFGGATTMLWNPSVSNLGFNGNQIGFSITGTPNIPVEVDSCQDLANPTWVSLKVCSITNGSIYFGDLLWTNSLSRFYRIRSP